MEVDPDNGRKVRRIFDLYAYHGHTLDSLIEALAKEGLEYTRNSREFPRSKLYAMLRDRAYLGEVRFRGQWYPGTHEPLIDRTTWDRLQVLLGDKIYHSHELTYACELVRCGECGRPITGERKIKATKQGERDYVYYRCTRYNSDGHRRLRVREEDMDQQVLALFDRLRIKEEKVREWFLQVLRARVRENQQADRDRVAELNRQLTSLRQQQDRLLNLRLLDEIDESTFAAKSTELRDRIARLSLDVEACDRNRSEKAAQAEKVFELSQTLKEKWFNADVTAKRQLLEIVCLNFRLDGATLVPAIRKPFDVLAEGLLVSYSRDSKIWNQMYETYATRLYGFILHLVRRDRRLAEDLHQETWMAAINGIAGFDPKRGEFSAWLFSIARNAVATHWRRAAQRAGDKALDETAGDAVAYERGKFPVEVLQQVERAEVVRAALLELDPDERNALIHKYVDSLPVESIAKRINRSAKATESLLTRSREKLRALLQWYFPLAEEEKR